RRVDGVRPRRGARARRWTVRRTAPEELSVIAERARRFAREARAVRRGPHGIPPPRGSDAEPAGKKVAPRTSRNLRQRRSIDGDAYEKHLEALRISADPIDPRALDTAGDATRFREHLREPAGARASCRGISEDQSCRQN